MAEKKNKGFKESWRKFIVSLKKRPHNIPLCMMVIAFIVYSFNLTKISNTTAVVNQTYMGLCEFVIMLFSVLAFVCFLNAYPKRQKPIVPMVILLYVLEIIILIADVVYISKINAGLQTIQINASRQFIPQAKSMLTVHIVLVVISIILIALIPVIGKALNKIDTSVTLAGNDDVAIELTDDDEAEAARSGGARQKSEN
ncbi:MAG: hypothetical protein IIY76_07715 [Erysipelotrichaceae bacterium]|nr:hypothetical protein [Erysipelotrichaceae bacterium]MBQ1625578.1 hypothetical protein [Erysipelotrichaceae bacterium]MBQ1812260.1 hypothetical protein [Erysipelotrichaceae bacterium]MBQ4019955.1 hypothetical protein [Erysipelotrichaceae bacterium]